MTMIPSSIRVIKNVENMNNVSSSIHLLRPVMFEYIESSSEVRHYGLVAEEVEKIMPNLVMYDKSNTPESVKYSALPVLLLNEIKKMSERIDLLESNCTCKGCD